MKRSKSNTSNKTPATPKSPRAKSAAKETKPVQAKVTPKKQIDKKVQKVVEVKSPKRVTRTQSKDPVVASPKGRKKSVPKSVKPAAKKKEEVKVEEPAPIPEVNVFKNEEEPVDEEMAGEEEQPQSPKVETKHNQANSMFEFEQLVAQQLGGQV